MRKFIIKIFWFVVPLLLFAVITILLPVTPYASKSLLFGNLQKDSLLLNTNQPRIIFIGGSNLSFGLNSYIIKDSLNVNPINTGVHAGLGLIYMLENALQYIVENDIIILIPEYEQFYGELAYGSNELLRELVEVNPKNQHLLNIRQLFHILPYVPKFSLSKFNPNEYHNYIVDSVYNVNSFNKYGDTDVHWGMGKKEFKPQDRITEKFNSSVMQQVIEFKSEIEKRKAVMYVSFPCLQNASFNNLNEEIKNIESEYRKNGFNILGYPEEFIFQDSMMFNTPYHLNKKGVDLRTSLLIREYRKANPPQSFNQSRAIN